MSRNWLPDEVEPKASYRQLMIVALVLVVLIICANFGAVLYLRTRSSNLGYSLIRYKWSMLETLEEPVDVLILGDSSCNQGVDPAVIEQELGLSALNLCTIGDALLVNDAWMLDAYVERFGPPKFVLIVHVYDEWHRTTNQAALVTLSVIPADARSDIVRLDLNTPDKVRVVLWRNFPLYAESKTLASTVMHPFRVAEIPHPDERGFLARDQADPTGVEVDFEGHKDFLRHSEFKFSPVNQNALRAIGALAESREFQVYVAHSPVYRGLAQDRNFKNYVSDVTGGLAASCAVHQNVHLLSELQTFDVEQMQSVDHVTTAGATIYTGELVRQIRAEKAGPIRRQ